MKTKLLYLSLLLLPIVTIAQVQIASDIDGEMRQDQSGSSVSVSQDGFTVAIGAPANDDNGNNSGHVRVFRFNSGLGTWEQLGSDIIGPGVSAESGTSVSLSADGRIVAIGSPYFASSAGVVRVYELDINNNWVQRGNDIFGESSNDFSGTSVSLSASGDRVAIGATGNDDGGSNSGHTRVYLFSDGSGTWQQLGGDMDGEFAGDFSGGSVSLSSNGTTVAIGAIDNSGGGTNPGHVRVYKFDNNANWVQQGADIDGEDINNQSGASVSLSSDGNIVAIGATGNDDGGSNSGHVRVYQFNDSISAWEQLGSDIDGEGNNDRFGRYVSLSSDGTILAIKGLLNLASGTGDGRVRIYKLDSNDNWIQIGVDINGENLNDGGKGEVVLSSNGNILAVGAAFNDGNGTNSGHVRLYDLSAITLGVNEFTINSVLLYPNPTTSVLNIEMQTNLKQAIIYSVLGREILITQSITINTTNLKTGMYLIKIEDETGSVITKRFIKQ